MDTPWTTRAPAVLMIYSIFMGEYTLDLDKAVETGHGEIYS